MDENEEYLAVVSKYEQFLNSLTQEERRLLAEQLQHAVSFCKFDGEFLPMPIEKENLFKTVSQMERYIVDTNSNWQAESARIENQNKAFILGKTIADEQDNLRGLLFGSKVKLDNRNIFLLGVLQSGEKNIGDVIMLERLDYHFRSVFDETSLIQASKPKKERTDAKSLEYENEFKAGVEHERKVILLLLGKINDISQLSLPKELEHKHAQFLAFIQMEAPHCSGNYLKAVGVARHC